MSRRGRPRARAWKLTRCLRGRLDPGRQAQTEVSHPAEAGRKPLSLELKVAQRFPSLARVPPTSKGTWGHRAASCPIPAGKGDHVHGRTPGQVGHLTSGEAGELAGRRAALPGALARPAGPLRVRPDQPGLGAPRGPTERSSSLHHGPREGVSRGPGLLQPEVFLTPPGCRLPRPSLAPGSALIQGLAAQLSRGRRPPSRAGLGGISPGPGPACDFSRAATVTAAQPCPGSCPWAFMLLRLRLRSLGGLGLSQVVPRSVLCF